MARYPIDNVKIKEFGPFRDANVALSSGLNVIVGNNGAGKSQLLKLLYSCAEVVHGSESFTKKELNVALASKLKGVFRPDKLGRLTRRRTGRTTAEVSLKFRGIAEPLAFNFSNLASKEVSVEKVPNARLEDQPVYLPPHELLTLSASFVSLFDQYGLDFDETWRDTVSLLLVPALRGPRGEQASQVLGPFTDLLEGGKVSENNGRFYLSQPGIGNLEAPLLAEGHRKLAMIVRLIANGQLLEGGYLFWDEPEANLNPASQKAVCQALLYLAESGAQVFVATHSSYLLRELQMSESTADINYIGLSRQTPGESHQDTVAHVTAESSSELEELSFIASLDAEAQQAERFLAW